MRWEVQPIVRALGAVRRVRRDGLTVWESLTLPVIVFRTGMGPERAAAATRALLDAYSIQALVNSGCAGGLIEGLGPGAVVIPETVYDGTRAPVTAYPTHPSLVEKLRRATECAGLSAHPGPIHTTDVPLTTPESKQAAHERSGSAAVEMEGAAVAGVASQRGIAFASLRIILDDSATPVPTFRALVNTDGLIARFKLNSNSVTLPAPLTPVLSLASGVRAVRTVLHSVFHSLFEPSDELTE